ncbi:MAG: hypothetical protein WC628_03465 [Candidatus Omnitrophota bacterium]
MKISRAKKINPACFQKAEAVLELINSFFIYPQAGSWAQPGKIYNFSLILGNKAGLFANAVIEV